MGSDIALNQKVLTSGMKVKAAELGIMATVGCVNVRCYKRPVIGVMSTGNEVCGPLLRVCLSH